MGNAKETKSQKVTQHC